MSIILNATGKDYVAQFSPGIRELTWPKTMTLHMDDNSNGRAWLEPHKADPWTGEGLPPVGTVCETVCGGIVRKVEILCVTDRHVFISESERNYEWLWDRENPGSRTFRPIRTPEQIAADEREKEAQELFEILNPEGKWHKFDNNGKDRYRRAAIAYRKQVPE